MTVNLSHGHHFTHKSQTVTAQFWSRKIMHLNSNQLMIQADGPIFLDWSTPRIKKLWGAIRQFPIPSAEQDFTVTAFITLDQFTAISSFESVNKSRKNSTRKCLHFPELWKNRCTLQPSQESREHRLQPSWKQREVVGGRSSSRAGQVPASPCTAASCLFQAKPRLSVGTAACHHHCHGSTHWQGGTKKTQERNSVKAATLCSYSPKLLS